MTVTRHFKKKSRLSFPFLLQPHLQVGIFLMLMMRFFGRLHESLRGEKCCLIRAKLFKKKKCMFKIYKLFRSYMVTVQKLLRHCVKLGVASRLPQISPEALTLCCFFFLFLRLAVWTLLCSSIISKAQRMTFHQRGT